MFQSRDTNDPITVAGSNTPPNLEDDKKSAIMETIEVTETEKPKAKWTTTPPPTEAGNAGNAGRRSIRKVSEVSRLIWKFAGFMGPGAIISVAYIDPDNYQSALQSGEDFQYKLLFMILISIL